VPSLRQLLCGHLVAATLAVAAPLHAQRMTSLEAFAGYYRPFGQFDPASVIVAGELPEEPSDLSAVAFGATGHVSIGRRLGVAGRLATTMRSRVPAVVTPGGPRGPTDATVAIGALQAQYDVSFHPQVYHVWVNTGPGFVRHGGDAYRQYGSPTSLAAVVGTTVAVPIGPHLQLVADATALLYGFDLPTPPSLRAGRLEHGNQRDAMLHMGLAWTHH
jgi:hypothetical protein